MTCRSAGLIVNMEDKFHANADLAGGGEKKKGLTKQSVLLGPVQPPAHWGWQHWLGRVP